MIHASNNTSVFSFYFSLLSNCRIFFKGWGYIEVGILNQMLAIAAIRKHVTDVYRAGLRYNGLINSACPVYSPIILTSTLFFLLPSNSP